MSRQNRLLFRILFFVYLAGVLLLCFWHFNSLPSAPQSLWGIPLDKIIHVIMFLPFPLLAFLAFDRFTETVSSSLLFTSITFVVGFLIALGTELGQAWLTDYRNGDPLDLAADMVAITLGCVVVFLIDTHKQKKS